MTYRWLFDELLCFSTFLCSQMSSSHSSHWWQRWSTSIRSLDPFKADLDDLSTLFVRSRILETTTWEHDNYSIRLCWWIKGNFKDPIAFVHSGKEFAGCFIRRNKNTCFRYATVKPFSKQGYFKPGRVCTYRLLLTERLGSRSNSPKISMVNNHLRSI